ncbi:unnamed protein product [Cuscuta campestris]|uniref:SWIM-type domain-containing protein n=1 Tax=Cuscuta campestris TaxID=132261 RepID=A0A484MN96_9ASTE|nr:unnamed protein product [Cuscuta campestris]
MLFLPTCVIAHNLRQTKSAQSKGERLAKQKAVTAHSCTDEDAQEDSAEEISSSESAGASLESSEALVMAYFDSDFTYMHYEATTAQEPTLSHGYLALSGVTDLLQPGWLSKGQKHILRAEQEEGGIGLVKTQTEFAVRSPQKEEKEQKEITMCKKGLDTLFEKLANAYTKRSFKRLYGDLKARYPAAGNYIDNIPKKRLVRAYFEINRYQIMTTNGAESINSVLREDRELPIVALLKAVQNMTSRWRGKRQQELRSLDASNPPVTPAVEAEMRKRFSTALRLECHQLNQYEFEIKGVHSDHVVNLSNKTCTCQVFDKDKIPCVHALACSERTGIDCYSLCSKLYTKEYMYIAYAETIYLVPHEDD